MERLELRVQMGEGTPWFPMSITSKGPTIRLVGIEPGPDLQERQCLYFEGDADDLTSWMAYRLKRGM